MLDSLNSIAPLTETRQGYELSEEEVRISLNDFKSDFSDSFGGVEYAALPPRPIARSPISVAARE